VLCAVCCVLCVVRLNGAILVVGTCQTGLSKLYGENILNTKLGETKINSEVFDTPCKALTCFLCII
jgi:hypothetical protein